MRLASRELSGTCCEPELCASTWIPTRALALRYETLKTAWDFKALLLLLICQSQRALLCSLVPVSMDWTTPQGSTQEGKCTATPTSESSIHSQIEKNPFPLCPPHTSEVCVSNICQVDASSGKSEHNCLAEFCENG